MVDVTAEMMAVLKAAVMVGKSDCEKVVTLVDSLVVETAVMKAVD